MVSSLALSGWACAHECVFDRRNCRRRFVHTFGGGWLPLCQDAKSFLVSNLAPAPLRVPALSHSFIYICFLIRSRPGGDAAPPRPCRAREGILSPRLRTWLFTPHEWADTRAKGAAERVRSTRHCRRTSAAGAIFKV